MLFNVQVVHGIAIACRSVGTVILLRLFRLSICPVNIGENTGLFDSKSTINKETPKKKVEKLLNNGAFILV